MYCIPAVFLSFITVALAENSRLTMTSGVIKAYGTIMSAYRGEVTCSVTTAKVHTELCPVAMCTYTCTCTCSYCISVHVQHKRLWDKQ